VVETQEAMNVLRNVVSLGAALHTVLRESSARALASSLVLDDNNTTTTSPLHDALHSLRSHASAEDVVRGALQTCLSDERARGDMRVTWRNTETLVAWLLQLPRRDEFANALANVAGAIGGAEERKAALLAWMLLRERLRRLRQAHADAVKAIGAPSEKKEQLNGAAKIVDISPDADRFTADAQLRAIKLLRTDIVAAVAVVPAVARSVVADDDDHNVDENRRRADAESESRATRLRVTALDALLDAAALLADAHSFEHSVLNGASAEVVLGDEGARATAALLDALLRCLPAVRRWFERPRPLFAFALERLERLLRGISTLEPRSAVLDLSVYHLSFFAPYAVSDAASVQPSELVATVQRLLDNVYHPLQPLSGPLPEEELEKEAEEQSFRSCLAICLALGRHSERRMNDALRDVPAARLLDVAVGQFHGPAQNATARIAAQLASAAISVVQRQDALSLLEPLTDLLKSSVPASVPRTHERIDLMQRDSVADATALLLARVIGAIDTPGALRSALGGLLDANDDKVQAAMQRRNALLLLEQLLVVVADVASDAPLVVELAQVLLDRLGDDEVQLRSAAARLFGRLDSTFIVGELVRRALSRDVRERSAAERALLEHMQQLPPSQLPNALVLVLNEAEKSGAASAADNVGESAAGDVGARVLRTLPQWLSALSFEQGATTMRQCVDAALAMPRSPVGARLVGGVARALPQHAAGAAEAICALLHSQARLSEAALEEVADDAARLGSMLFGRVAPLLLVRALPARSLLDANDELVVRLCASLRDRIEEQVEFDQVRKLAAECLARLPVAFDVALPHLSDKSIDVAKGYMFTLLNAVAANDGHADALPTERIIDALIAVMARPVANKDVEQLQRGAIDCLACVVNVSLSAPVDKVVTATTATPALLDIATESTSSLLQIVEPNIAKPSPAPSKPSKKPLIVELGGGGDVVVDLPQQLMERVVSGRDPLQVRVCVGNSLIVLAGAIGDVRRHRCFGTVVNGALGALRVAEASGLLPLLLQLLFAWVYHGRMMVAAFAVELVQAAVQLARHRESAVRFGAVKLLGALLSNEATDELISSANSPLSEIGEALTFAASDGASDASTRALAEQLSGALKVR
jgi:hypothetical protein